MDLREELSGKRAECTGLTGALEVKVTELRDVQHKLSEGTAMLQQADIRSAQQTAELGALQRELTKEQRDLADTQMCLASTQEQLDKAKHWNDIQVCWDPTHMAGAGKWLRLPAPPSLCFLCDGGHSTSSC